MLKFKAEEGVDFGSNAVAYHAPVEICNPFDIPSRSLARLKNLGQGKVSASESLDLHYLKTILVTTAWNKNDDVFDPWETWIARATPEDKPFNYEHNFSDIIGHIISCWCVDTEGKIVADDTDTDSLPAKYHVATGAVLYKIWDKQELQERMDTILAEIAEDKWFVSMECLFKGFDYALKGTSGNRVIARKEDTAFLTKYLRAYGGPGVYNGEKIGRVLRNITFSGKGLVRRPANEDSIIFAKVDDFNSKNIFQNFSSAGYSSANPKKGNQMDELNDVKQQLASAKREVAELTKQLRDYDVEKVQAKTEEAIAQKQAAEENLAKANEKIAELEKQFEAKAEELKIVHEKLTESDKLRETIEAQLQEIRDSQKRQERIEATIEKLEVSKDEAVTFVDASKLDDEAFEVQLTLLAAMKVKLPPKSTSVPEAPKSTTAPAPMKGEAEVDDKGEKAASETDLGEVEEEETPSGVTAEEDQLDSVKKQIAACFV